MKISAERNLESASKETLSITMEWNPGIDSEESLVALVATIVDLVNNYNRFNTESED